MISISKYHGLGNDFIITTFEEVKDIDLSTFSIAVCDRHTGIGADGIIIVKEKPLEMIYYNSDGSRAKMCGNGIRCFVKYCVDNTIIISKEATISTLAGDIHIKIDSIEPFMVTVNMGIPDFSSKSIPVITDNQTFINQVLLLDGLEYNISSLLMGVTHTCLEVTDLEKTNMIQLGKEIQKLDMYPKSTNVNFYQIISPNQVKMQTYERGAGLTLACGTGACSVYALLKKTNKTISEIEIILPRGSLFISHKGEEILMKGPAERVMVGYYEVTK